MPLRATKIFISIEHLVAAGYPRDLSQAPQKVCYKVIGAIYQSRNILWIMNFYSISVLFKDNFNTISIESISNINDDIDISYKCVCILIIKLRLTC